MADGVSIKFRGHDGRIQPAGDRARAERIRSVALARWAAATSAAGRLAASVDFARAAAAAAARAGLSTAEMDRAARGVWAVGEALVRRLAGEEDDRG